MLALPPMTVLSAILIKVRCWPAPAAVVLRYSTSIELHLIALLELHGFARLPGLARQGSIQSLLGRVVDHDLDRDLA